MAACRPRSISPPGNRQSSSEVETMLVGVPKEIKDSEFRVGLVPSTVRELTANGHPVIVERSAGLGAGLADTDYRRSAPARRRQITRAELVVKVRPLAAASSQPGRVLFTYAPRRRPATDRRPDGFRRHRHCLRDRDVAARPAALRRRCPGCRPHGARSGSALLENGGAACAAARPRRTARRS